MPGTSGSGADERPAQTPTTRAPSRVLATGPRSRRPGRSAPPVAHLELLAGPARARRVLRGVRELLLGEAAVRGGGLLVPLVDATGLARGGVVQRPRARAADAHARHLDLARLTRGPERRARAHGGGLLLGGG